MPRYYLHVRLPHTVVTDASGREFEDLAEAICLANGLIRGVNLTPSSSAPHLLRVEIFDDDGLIATVPTLPVSVPLPGAGRA